MSWIDERVSQLQNLMVRNRAVELGSEGLYEDLWNEIAGRTTEACDKGLRVGTKGNTYERIVWTSDPGIGKSSNRRELRISLRKDH